MAAEKLTEFPLESIRLLDSKPRTLISDNERSAFDVRIALLFDIVIIAI